MAPWCWVVLVLLGLGVAGLLLASTGSLVLTTSTGRSQIVYVFFVISFWSFCFGLLKNADVIFELFSLLS